MLSPDEAAFEYSLRSTVTASPLELLVPRSDEGDDADELELLPLLSPRSASREVLYVLEVETAETDIPPYRYLGAVRSA